MIHVIDQYVVYIQNGPLYHCFSTSGLGTTSGPNGPFTHFSTLSSYVWSSLMLIIRCLLTLCLIGGLWTVHKPAYQWHHRWGFQYNRNDSLSLPGKLACRNKSHFPCINKKNRFLKWFLNCHCPLQPRCKSFISTTNVSTSSSGFLNWGRLFELSYPETQTE